MDSHLLELKTQSLFQELAPRGWRLVLCRPFLFWTRALGWTNFKAKKVYFNMKVSDFGSWHFCREVLLHELAHIEAGATAGHGDAWKRKAHKLGCMALDRAVRIEDLALLTRLDE